MGCCVQSRRKRGRRRKRRRRRALIEPPWLLLGITALLILRLPPSPCGPTAKHSQFSHPESLLPPASPKSHSCSTPGLRQPLQLHFARIVAPSSPSLYYSITTWQCWRGLHKPMPHTCALDLGWFSSAGREGGRNGEEGSRVMAEEQQRRANEGLFVFFKRDYFAKHCSPRRQPAAPIRTVGAALSAVAAGDTLPGPV